MGKLIGYVIYNNDEDLSSFLQQSNKTLFIPVKKQELSSIQLLKDSLFNIERFKSIFNREPFSDEIANTLSHIMCWRKIAENDAINDNEYALIAESDISLIPNFYELCQVYIEKYPYDIIKLQRNIKSNNIQDLKLSNGDIENIGAVIYSNSNELDSYGSSFYLIRKNIAKKLLDNLKNDKPFWRSDYFSLFYDHSKILEINEYLSHKKSNYKKESPEKPLFSVIVPIYNVENYLQQCLDSVLNQDFNNFEIILVNDGSTDHCLDICIKYAKKYQNITVVSQMNQGLSVARNSGIKMARGEYLIFLDPDDFWEGKNIFEDLEKIIIEKNNPDLIINTFTYQLIKENNRRESSINLNNIRDIDDKQDFDKNYKRLVEQTLYIGFAQMKIIKREIVVSNNIYFSYKIFEDVDWSIALAPHIKTFCIFPYPFYIYRVGRIGALTEFVTRNKFIDLIEIVSNKFEELQQIKNASPKIYEGSLTFLQKTNNYIELYYSRLDANEKFAVSTLYESYIRKAENIFIKGLY